MSPEGFIKDFKRRLEAKESPPIPERTEPPITSRGTAFDARVRPQPVLDELRPKMICSPEIIHNFESELPSKSFCCDDGACDYGVTDLSEFFEKPDIATVPVPLLHNMWWRVKAEGGPVYASGPVKPDGTLSLSNYEDQEVKTSLNVSCARDDAGVDLATKEFKTSWCYTEELNLEVGCFGDKQEEATWPDFEDNFDDGKRHC